MNTDVRRIAVRMDADPRFAAAAGGAIRILAENAGMPEEVCREFQQATVQACLEAFREQPMRSHTVEFLVYGDRLEVAVDAETGKAAIRLSRSVVSQS